MNLKPIAVSLALALSLSACGNKGALVLPTRSVEEMTTGPVDEASGTDPTDAQPQLEIDQPPGAEPASATPAEEVVPEEDADAPPPATDDGDG